MNQIKTHLNYLLKGLPFQPRYFAIIALLFCLIAGLGLSFRIAMENREHRYDTNLENPRDFIGNGGNEIGKFSLVRRDPHADYRPILAVNFDQLQAENGQLGVFNTGLYKLVKMQNLCLKFFEYAPAGDLDLSDHLRSILPLPSANGPDGMTGGFSQAMNQRLSWPHINWVSSIDLSNATKVEAINFHYELFADNELTCRVQCKKAQLELRSQEIQLRGHVIVTVPKVGCLESNNIKWDFPNKHFTAAGVYVLKRGGQHRSGKGICVDRQLNVIGEALTKFNNGGSELCLTRH